MAIDHIVATAAVDRIVALSGKDRILPKNADLCIILIGVIARTQTGQVAPAATLPPVSISSTDGDGGAAAPQPAHTSDGETVEVAEVKDAPAPVESVEG